MLIRFKMTCSACPEQYDAYTSDGEKVGYVRLRHGFLSVTCPDVGGVAVYEAWPRGDGCFDNATERDYHLRFATQAIEKWITDGKPLEVPPPPAPNVIYAMEDFHDPYGE